MSSAKLPRLRATPRGNWSNFLSTPIWLGYPQLGCYQCNQPIVLGSLWWRLWSTAINEGNINCWNDKDFIKQIKYVHINIFHKSGLWFKFPMEFLRPILAKIELICQQPAMPLLSGIQGVTSQSFGFRIGWLGLMGWSGYDMKCKVNVQFRGPDFYTKIWYYFKKNLPIWSL